MAKVTLDFRKLILSADIFPTRAGEQFIKGLPYKNIPLTTWGHEAYGSIDAIIDPVNPQPTIPSGGLAYSKKGSYLCIFYGQVPAWPVEYIGQVEGDSWLPLKGSGVELLDVTLASFAISDNLTPG